MLSRELIFVRFVGTTSSSEATAQAPAEAAAAATSETSPAACIPTALTPPPARLS